MNRFTTLKRRAYLISALTGVLSVYGIIEIGKVDLNPLMKEYYSAHKEINSIDSQLGYCRYSLKTLAEEPEYIKESSERAKMLIENKNSLVEKVDSLRQSPEYKKYNTKGSILASSSALAITISLLSGLVGGLLFRSYELQADKE